MNKVFLNASTLETTGILLYLNLSVNPTLSAELNAQMNGLMKPSMIEGSDGMWS